MLLYHVIIGQPEHATDMPCITPAMHHECICGICLQAYCWKRPELPNYTVTELGEWLSQQGFQHLVKAFRAERIDGEALLRIKAKLEDYPKLKTTPEDRDKLLEAIERAHK